MLLSFTSVQELVVEIRKNVYVLGVSSVVSGEFGRHR